MLAAQPVKAGFVRDVADLYRHKLDELANLERMGERPRIHEERLVRRIPWLL